MLKNTPRQTSITESGIPHEKEKSPLSIPPTTPTVNTRADIKQITDRAARKDALEKALQIRRTSSAK